MFINFILQFTRVQSSTCTTYGKCLWEKKMAVLIPKSGISKDLPSLYLRNVKVVPALNAHATKGEIQKVPDLATSKLTKAIVFPSTKTDIDSLKALEILRPN